MQPQEHPLAQVAQQVTIWQLPLSQVARVAQLATIQRPLVRLHHVLQAVQRAPMQPQEHPLAQVAQQVTIWQLPLSQVARVAQLATIQRPLVRLLHVLQHALRGPIQRRDRPHARVAQQVLTLQRLRPRVRLVSQDIAALGLLLLLPILLAVVTGIVHH